MIDITGLKKSEVLLALWKNSHAQGLSFLGRQGEFTLEKAELYVKEKARRKFEIINPEGTDEEFEQWFEIGEFPEMTLYFDYLEGHVIKSDISRNEFHEQNYDRDCGEGVAQEAINALREQRLDSLDEMSENDDFMRCCLDMLKDDYDRKHGVK